MNNFIKISSIILIFSIFIIYSILYYFNFTVDYIQTFIGTADGFRELYNISIGNLSSHTNYILYVLNTLFDIKYGLYIYNILSLIFFLIPIYIYLKRYNKDLLFIIFITLLLFNSYVFTFIHEIDKPFYVAIYFFTSLFYLFNYIDTNKKSFLFLFILSLIISLFSYISAIFFLPIIFIAYIVYKNIKIFTPKNIFIFFILFIIGIITLYFLSKNFNAVGHSLSGIKYVFLGGNFENITGFGYLKAISKHIGLPILILLFVLFFGFLISNKSNDKKIYTILLIAFLYITFLFSIQSKSFSTGSRYPFYSIIFVIYLISIFIYNILLTKNKNIKIFGIIFIFVFTISGMYPFNYYYRGLWNSHYYLCDYFIENNINSSKIAFLKWPSINYYCNLKNVDNNLAIDDRNNTFTNYGWNENNLQKVKKGIDNNVFDYIIVDFSGADYINSSGKIKSELVKQNKYILVENFKNKNIFVYAKSKG